MAQEKVQAQKQARKTEQEQSEDQAQKQQNSLNDEVDEMLAEIDGVLEENAEEFVKSYVQKGGEATELNKAARDILRAWTIIGSALSAAKRSLTHIGEDRIYRLVVA